MRGKGSPHQAIHSKSGITPAHAGKSKSADKSRCRKWDHPRACGEKNQRSQVRIIGLGSPPRMRGKVHVTTVSSLPSRITPAHAGKSDRHRMRSIVCQDHPRACGEKPSQGLRPHFLQGSPPRMRGKVLSLVILLLRMGITPAHAGKRVVWEPQTFDFEDHPRACGEKCNTGARQSEEKGSPPRMRGKD